MPQMSHSKMLHIPLSKDEDEIYQELDISEDYTPEHLQRDLDDLEEVGLIRHMVHDDQRIYYARDGLSWADIVQYDNPIRNQILKTLINNPKGFAILYNTQKGKCALIAAEVERWSNMTDKKVIPIVFVDNAKDQADQTGEALKGFLGDEKYNVMILSSNHGLNVGAINDKIDLYAGDLDNEHKIPVIVALTNNDQRKKVIQIIARILKKVTTRNSPLRYGIIYDEADKTYPTLRDSNAEVDGETCSLYRLTIANETAVHRIGWVSATEGDMLEDYPEVYNAMMHPVPEGSTNYRAFHHEDAIIHCVQQSVRDNNDSYALRIINGVKIVENDGTERDLRQHFKTPIRLANGQNYYRKTIINSTASVAKQNELAKEIVEKDMYAITVNMSGVRLHRKNMPILKFSSKGRRFNEVLFYIYKKLNLHDKPLFIIGRRKVDRGIGFHYAPRLHDDTQLPMPKRISEVAGMGDLMTDGIEGLIWTDMILGKIGDKDTAVQKAGRLAGIIAMSQYYHGHIDFWTDVSTASSITRHNNVVDIAGTKRGCSVLQAVEHAKSENPAVAIQSPCDHLLSDVFATQDDAKAWCEAQLNSSAKCGLFKDDDRPTTSLALATKYKCYIGENDLVSIEIATVLGNRISPNDVNRIRRAVHTGAKARIMPVKIGTVNKCVVVYSDRMRKTTV